MVLSTDELICPHCGSDKLGVTGHVADMKVICGGCFATGPIKNSTLKELVESYAEYMRTRKKPEARDGGR